MTNKTKQSNKVITVLVQTLIELLLTIKFGFMKELGNIATIIQIVIPVVIVHMGLNIPQMVIVSCCITVISRYIKDIGYKLNNVSSSGIPIPRIRHTIRSEDGIVSVEPEVTQEAVLYLCDVEDYLAMKGLI